MNKWIAILTYLVIVNVAGFLMAFIDKRKAIKNKWRVPEKSLFLSAILGGGIGLYMGFKTFRHKTLHKRFMIGVPLIVILQLLIIIFFIIQFKIS